MSFKEEPATIRRVAIIGGGTAGWMASAMLAKSLQRGLQITLVESEEIGTVGVGEATIPPIRSFNGSLGFPEEEFIRDTQATFKLAIQFENWGHVGNRYMHAFGTVGQDLGSSFQHYWRRSTATGGTSDFWDFSLNCQAARGHRFVRAQQQGKPLLSYAYHFDATRYAKFLRRFSEALGVQRVEGQVVDATLHPTTGFIESVTLASGQVIAADLFIDCTGFQAILANKVLGVGYESWSHWLPCDRAVAMPSEYGQPGQSIPPYTRAIAHPAGWQWWVPLQQRIGNGLVYSSELLSDDAAIELLLNSVDGNPLADPRILRFTPGRREQQWHKNCISLGLASGFIEPLESTSIHLIQSSITRLVAMFPRSRITPEEIDEFNRQTAVELERIRDFIILHYHVNQRTDSPLWRGCREMEIPPQLRRRIDLFQGCGKIFREHDELFSKVAWLQVLIGQGIIPQDYHPVADEVEAEEVHQFLDRMRDSVASTVASLPSHDEVIRRCLQACSPANADPS